MLNRRQFASLISLAVLGTAGPARGADAPALMLANVYRPGATPLADYWVSEKYDGVRGYWDGQRLLTRGGEAIAAPAWFTDGWPAVPMDGELWAGRGRFSQAASTVRQQKPMDDAWRALRFMVFDLPAQGGPFDKRINAYQQLVASLGQPWVQAVVQRKVASDAELQALLRQTVKAGGEGLMLHRGTSLYYGKVEERGIRCCYHGWLFDVQGHCLEQPCEPGGGAHRGKVRQPWYPVQEQYGLIWAYLGPADKKPVLPRYECLETLEDGEFIEADDSSIGGGGPQVIPCNWLQHYENLVDPFHVVILHSSFSGTQFVPQMAVIVRPTPLNAVKAVSRANELMPQKSTFFYPKLATGLFINPLE